MNQLQLASYLRNWIGKAKSSFNLHLTSSDDDRTLHGKVCRMEVFDVFESLVQEIEHDVLSEDT